MSTYPYTGNEYSDKTDHVDRILAEHINDLQDEVAAVEGVLTGGTDGQVLTADETGKANWEDASGGGLQAVTVNGDWSDASQAWSDIKSATGMQDFTADLELQISLWEGNGDPGDYGYLSVRNSFGVISPNFEIPFSSYPSSGTAYILGINVLED